MRCRGAGLPGSRPAELVGWWGSGREAGWRWGGGGGGGEVGGRHWGSRAAEPEPGALGCAPLSGKCHH